MYQGTYVTDEVRSKEFDPQKLIPNIHNEMFDLDQQKKELDVITQLDRLHLSSTQARDPQLEATISALETAYRRCSTFAKRPMRCRNCTEKEARLAGV